MDGSEAYGVPLAAVLEEWSLPVRVEDLLQVWQHVVVDPGVLAAAKELREQGLVCALGTNQHRERAAYMRRELGYERVFDPIVISAEIGVAKPDPEFCRRALVRLGLPAAEVLFVDDVQANVDAARSVGPGRRTLRPARRPHRARPHPRPARARGARRRLSQICGRGTLDVKSPPRTRQSSLTLAAVKPWGSWVRCRHAGDLDQRYAMTAVVRAGPAGSGRVRTHRSQQVRFRAEDSPRGLWRSLGKRVGFTPSRVRIPHPPPP